MMTEQSVGAASHASLHWRDIDWRSVNRNVSRLQVRIVKAVEAGRWGKVKALQRLLTHSRDGKLLAVRRVTDNQGKKTTGVDGVVWDTPAKKMAAVHAMRSRGYRPLPLRRIPWPGCWLMKSCTPRFNTICGDPAAIPNAGMWRAIMRSTRSCSTQASVYRKGFL